MDNSNKTVLDMSAGTGFDVLDEQALSAALQAALQTRETANGCCPSSVDLRISMERALRRHYGIDKVTPVTVVVAAMLEEALTHRFARLAPEVRVTERVLHVPVEAFGPVTESEICDMFGPRSTEAVHLLIQLCNMVYFPRKEGRGEAVAAAMRALASQFPFIPSGQCGPYVASLGGMVWVVLLRVPGYGSVRGSSDDELALAAVVRDWLEQYAAGQDDVDETRLAAIAEVCRAAGGELPAFA